MSHAPHTHAHTHTRTRRCTFLSCEMERLAWLKKSSPDAAALTSRCAASSTHRPHRAMLARAAGSAASRGGGSCVNTAHGQGRRLRDGSLNTGAERNLQKAVQSVPALGESAKDARGTLVTPPCRACALHSPFHDRCKRQSDSANSICSWARRTRFFLSLLFSERAADKMLSSPGSRAARRRAFMVLAATGELLGVCEGCSRVRAGVWACAVAPACEPSCAQAAVVRCAPARPRPRVLTDAGVTGPLFARATPFARTLPAGLCLVALLQAWCSCAQCCWWRA